MITTVAVAFRLETRLVKRLRAATRQKPYAPTQTEIVSRGIELALTELKQNEAVSVASNSAQRQRRIRQSTRR